MSYWKNWNEYTKAKPGIVAIRNDRNANKRSGRCEHRTPSHGHHPENARAVTCRCATPNPDVGLATLSVKQAIRVIGFHRPLYPFHKATRK